MIIHLKYTQIATYLEAFFSFFKVCDGVLAQLVEIYIQGKKFLESAFSKGSYII